MDSRKKIIFFYFIMATGVLAASLVLSEICFRFVRPYDVKYVKLGDRVYPLYGLTSNSHYTFDPVSGYALIPNLNDQQQFITTDEHGFRVTGRKFDPQQPSIIFVGDSTVFGWGVQDSSAFSHRLNQKKGFEGFNIINMGVPAYSLGHIEAVLLKKVPQFNPKIVFVAILWPWKPFAAYSTKNAWKEIDFDFYRKTIPTRTKYFNPRALLRAIVPRTFYVIRDYVFQRQYHEQVEANMTRPGIRDFEISPEEERSLALDHINVLRQAAAGLRAQGIEVVFYIHPYQYTIFHEDYRDLGKTGKELMVSELGAIDMGPYLKEKFTGNPLFIDGSHLTDLGHEFYAEYFYSFLQDKLNIQGDKLPAAL